MNLGATDGALTAGSAGSVATAGSGGGEAWQVSSQPLLVSESLQLSNPTLTDDLQQIYYTQQPDGDEVAPTVVMHATFDGQQLGNPAELELVPDMYGVANPAISPDGKELWFSRRDDKLGTTDIWRSLGQGDSWDDPVPVPELRSDFDDSPRPPALTPRGPIMPLASKRHGSVLWQIYFAMRGADGTWSAPSQEHLARINSPDYLSADGFLSADGLSLFFASRRTGNADLYVARRASLDEDFGEPAALDGVNTPYEERLPWLSADERTLYFASNQLGNYAVYVATREPP